MITIGVRELKQKASQMIRLVREDGEEIRITYHGKVVALIIPSLQQITEPEPQSWLELDDLAARISASWPSGISAVEAITEARQ